MSPAGARFGIPLGWVALALGVAAFFMVGLRRELPHGPAGKGLTAFGWTFAALAVVIVLVGFLVFYGIGSVTY